MQYTDGIGSTIHLEEVFRYNDRMKKKLLFLILLISGFVIFLLVNEFLLKNRTPMGRIKIVAAPSAGVFIDNVALGKTPFEQKIEAGEYQVKLIPEGVAEETVSWQGKVQVVPDSLTYINRELGPSDIASAGEIFTVVPMENPPEERGTGDVYVETEPSGAIVYLDNDEKGVSPLLMQGVTQGDHEISVFMPGFFRRTHKINVDAGHTTNTTFKLALDEAQKDINQVQQAAEEQAASEEAEIQRQQREAAGIVGDVVEILQTPTGWLRVRAEPTTNSAEVAKVNPGERYLLGEEENGWYEIIFDDESSGWVSDDYAKIVTVTEQEAEAAAAAAAAQEEESAEEEQSDSSDEITETDSQEE